NLYADGEAAHFRRRALELGVPEEAVLVEPNATNTGQNVSFSRKVLAAASIRPASLTLIATPYMERRAYTTFAKQRPGVDLVCASAPTTLEDYLARFEDPHLVISMMVGDLQRVIEYPKRGFAIEQEVPEDVHAALKRLVVAGFGTYLLGS
ncbi:MAG TPA: YdcF family protein, partial [Bryobacteraceae bacterium]